MKYIESKENPSYKRAVRIAAGRKVGSPPLIWLEGVHLAQAWLDAGYEVETAFFDSQRLAEQAELQAVATRLAPERCIALNAGLMRQLSQVEQGQGIGLVVQAPHYDDSARIEHSCLYLDRIQDPGNVGTLLRTMAAAGIKQAYLSPGCAWAWSQKVLRSAQGAHFAIQIHEQVPAQQFIQRLAIPLYATALEQAVSLYTLPMAPQVAWVFGNEGQGVAPELLDAATQRVFIPQEAHVESLNVAAAAAVCLFEQRRQALVHTLI